MFAPASSRQVLYTIRKRGAGPDALHPATTWWWI